MCSPIRTRSSSGADPQGSVSRWLQPAGRGGSNHRLRHFGNFAVPTAVFSAALFIALVGLADDIKSIQCCRGCCCRRRQPPSLAAPTPGSCRHARCGSSVACCCWPDSGVNLVNFMDGLDLMTVAEVVPIASAIVLLGWLGELPASTTLAAAALFGAMLGFAPFNRPVAKIFLGDVGSLPIGLLVGWCLLQLAWYQQFAAALLLPLYYLADATVTLLRRIAQREPFWAAHRTHFYQRATDNGLSVARGGEVFALNVALAILGRRRSNWLQRSASRSGRWR